MPVEIVIARRLFLLVVTFAGLWAEAKWLLKKDAGSVVEKYHVSYDVKKDGSYSEIVEYGVRVQGEDAKTSASLFTIDYNSLTEKVEVVEAFTRNGREMIKVEPSGIEDRDRGESKDYDVMKVRSVVFPQVQIGSRLYVKYRVTVAKPVIKDRWSESFLFGRGQWVESFRLEIASERPLYFDLRDPNSLLEVKPLSPGRIVARSRKEFGGAVHSEKDPYYHPSGSTELWVSTENVWGVYFSGVAKDYEDVQSGGAPPRLSGWVRSAKGKKTVEARILALMERMSQEFRYFGDWRRHQGGFIPRPLVEIEKSRYGDCKDLSSLLVSLLRAMDLKANVALVRRGDNPYGVEPDYKLPAMGRFNHAVVRLQTPDGRVLWLDPTNPVASLKPLPDIAGRPAWVLDPAAPRFDRVPEIRTSEMRYVQEYEYRFREDNAVGVRVNASWKGLAPFRLANQLLMSPRAEVLTSTLDYFTEGNDVKSFKYIHEPKTGRTLADMSVDLNYDAAKVTFNAGRGSFFVIPDGFLSGPFYETEDRESDLHFSDEPYSFLSERRLKDTRLVQDPPATCRIESEWMDLERQVRAEGLDVVIRQTVNLKKPYITKAEFRSPAFRRLQSESRRCFYRTGILIEATKGALSTGV